MCELFQVGKVEKWNYHIELSSKTKNRIQGHVLHLQKMPTSIKYSQFSLLVQINNNKITVTGL